MIRTTDDLAALDEKPQIFPPTLDARPAETAELIGPSRIEPRALVAQDFIDELRLSDGSNKGLKRAAGKVGAALKTLLSREDVQAELTRLTKAWKIDAKTKTEAVRAKLSEIAFSPDTPQTVALVALQAIGKDPEVGIYVERPTKVDINVLQYSPEVERAIMAADVIDVECITIPPAEALGGEGDGVPLPVRPVEEKSK